MTSPIDQDSSATVARIRRWTFETALPFWAARGVDRQAGGFVEHLDLDGRDPDVDFKRTRVLCRQIYVFAHAGQLGFPDGPELARHGFDFLTTHAWLGPDQGWARRMSRDGAPIDRTPDLYDLAFVLFSLGWCVKAGVAPEAAKWALATLDFIETHMRHPAGGFLHEKPADGWRQQNPHMHLLEAALVNYEATGDGRYRSLCDEIVGLFETRFCTADGALSEFFTEDLQIAPGEPGQLVEPGHQFEWAWILAIYQRMTGRDMGASIRALIEFAERHGVDHETGLVRAVVRRDGSVVDPCPRVWPNTERIQAAVALFETHGVDPRSVFAQSGGVLLDRYLSRSPAGTWTERFGVDGQPTEDKVPASTLYHLVIAFAEMLRVAPAVEERFGPAMGETTRPPSAPSLAAPA